MPPPDYPEFQPFVDDLDRPVLRRSLDRGEARDSSSGVVRFLQASDFHLDTPCRGVANLPTALRDRFVDARYLAAQRVFDAAIEQHVDFVVLAGGLIDARVPGLRGPWFLTEQFRRLEQCGINVYWSGATFESRGRWPSQIDVPGNVCRLAANADGMIHTKNGQPIARLVTVPPTSDISGRQSLVRHKDGLFTIAVQPRSEEADLSDRTGIDYWALGGQSHHETQQAGDVIAHYSGSPQGRTPSELGRHSCSLVSVGHDHRVEIDALETDVVRWHHERLDIDDRTTWAELEQRLEGRCVERGDDDHNGLAMVRWTVNGSGLAVQRLMQSGFRDELLDRLNGGQRHRTSGVWTYAIDATVDAHQHRQWYGQKTSLGVFLRELDGLSPHIHELFGTSTLGAHPLTETFDSNDRIVQRVINEGVHWLVGDDASMARAAS